MKTGNRRAPGRVSDLRVDFAKDARDLTQIVELEKRVFKDKTNLLDMNYGQEWIGRFPRSLSILRDSQGRALGFARCLPVTQSTYTAMRSSGTDIKTYLEPQNVLTNLQVLSSAIDGSGNYCNVGMVAYDPISKEEDYGELTRPLLRKLGDLFRQISLRALVCQSETTAEERAIADSGCRKASDAGRSIDGGRVVWYFDYEIAVEKPFKGLGIVFDEIWPSREEMPRLGLTRAEKEVLLLASWGTSPEEITKILHIKRDTLRTHWRNAFEKLKQVSDLKRITKQAVVDYCRQHPSEWFGPFAGTKNTQFDVC